MSVSSAVQCVKDWGYCLCLIPSTSQTAAVPQGGHTRTARCIHDWCCFCSEFTPPPTIVSSCFLSRGPVTEHFSSQCLASCRNHGSWCPRCQSSLPAGKATPQFKTRSLECVRGHRHKLTSELSVTHATTWSQPALRGNLLSQQVAALDVTLHFKLKSSCQFRFNGESVTC